MATQLQLRKGTKIQNDAFTGAEAELTYDSTTKGLRIHDGSTQGGNQVPVLVAVQYPDANNGYTWYRKWSDGWVEQGGTCAADYSGVAVTFPVSMNDGNYQFQLSVGQGQLTGTVGSVAYNRTTTGMTVYTNYSSGTPDYICWEVKGLAA